jgi:CAAX prenyl protease-like protein
VAIPAALSDLRERYPAVPYIAPFVGIFLFLSGGSYWHLSPFVEWPLQVLVLGLLCAVCWPPEIRKLPVNWLGSILIGLAVFLIWVGPDVLIRGYRSNILFSNSLLGAPHSSLPPEAQRSGWVVAWRTIRAATVVPIAEELFWRAWLIRWLIRGDFRSVPLGAYAPLAFFATAFLFASEHGPYWDVGLITGLIYNLWMVRTRSVADCILMHGVTNGVLSWYVLATGNWQYWM